MELYQNPHKMMQRAIAPADDKKTIEEVRRLIRAALKQEEDFKRLMFGASCDNLAMKSEGATQAFGQVLSWLSDVEA